MSRLVLVIVYPVHYFKYLTPHCVHRFDYDAQQLLEQLEELGTTAAMLEQALSQAHVKSIIEDGRIASDDVTKYATNTSWVNGFSDIVADIDIQGDDAGYISWDNLDV